MKSIRLAVAAGVVATLALAGCSSADGGEASTELTAQNVGSVGTTDELVDISTLCGDQDIVVGYADGNISNSWKLITREEFADEAAKCPNITDVIYTDAQGDTQTAISDVNSLVAQGVDVIVLFAPAGEALLPAVKKATEAGVAVVPFIIDLGGEIGTDYVDYVAEDVKSYGEQLAEWTIEAMGGTGNLVMLGGVAGNSYSEAVYEGVETVAANYPDVTLLNTDGPIATEWEPGKTQQVVAGLITQHGSIDGIVSDYGGGSVGGIRAFLAAGQPIPPWSANDSNEFACLWYEYKDSNPEYQIASISSRTWMSRLALRKAVAAAQGIVDPEPSLVQLAIEEDSLAGGDLEPQCDDGLPPDAILSSQLDSTQLSELFK